MKIRVLALYDYMCCSTLVVFKVHNKYYYTNNDDCSIDAYGDIDFDMFNKINTISKSDAVEIAKELLSDTNESDLLEMDSFESIEAAESDAGASNDDKLYLDVELEV